MKRYIYAMSGSRKDVGAEIEQGTRELIKHLIKLRLYPESESVNHWRREVAEKLHYVTSFRGSHKLPNSDFILKNSYDVHESKLKRYLDIVTLDYGEPEYDIDVNRLFHDIHRYFIWIAGVLEVDGDVAYNEIYQKLENMEF